MSSNRNTQVSDSDRASVWIKPDQFKQLQQAAYENTSYVHLQDRDHALVTFLYDSGARVGESTAFNREMLHLDEQQYYFPTAVQKQYPNDGEPSPARLSIDPENTTGAVASLRRYLNGRDDDYEALFITQKNTRMSKQAARNVVEKLAKRADIRPYTEAGSRATPDDLTPHVLRHSVAYRMLAVEEARLIDVRNRLRHTSISTSESIYEHFRIG